jgi:hypothetical protein
LPLKAVSNNALLVGKARLLIVGQSTPIERITLPKCFSKGSSLTSAAALSGLLVDKTTVGL